jgi:hypothetical protein
MGCHAVLPFDQVLANKRGMLLHNTAGMQGWLQQLQSCTLGGIHQHGIAASVPNPFMMLVDITVTCMRSIVAASNCIAMAKGLSKHAWTF